MDCSSRFEGGRDDSELQISRLSQKGCFRCDNFNSGGIFGRVKTVVDGRFLEGTFKQIWERSIDGSWGYAYYKCVFTNNGQQRIINIPTSAGIFPAVEDYNNITAENIHSWLNVH